MENLKTLPEKCHVLWNDIHSVVVLRTISTLRFYLLARCSVIAAGIRSMTVFEVRRIYFFLHCFKKMRLNMMQFLPMVWLVSHGKLVGRMYRNTFKTH